MKADGDPDRASHSATPKRSPNSKPPPRNPQSVDHTAQRLRDDRTRAALMADVAAAVTAQGLKIVDEDLNYWDYKGPMANIRDLRTIEGEPLTDDDADAAHIGFSYIGEVRITLVNTDWKAAEFTKPGATRSGPMTEDEKAERRRVIENNKAWDAVLLTELRGD